MQHLALDSAKILLHFDLSSTLNRAETLPKVFAKVRDWFLVGATAPTRKPNSISAPTDLFTRISFEIV